MTDARDFLPDGADLDKLRSAAEGCQGCDLYRNATQTVFGQGPADARVVLVGEQPGDQEDKAGLPFVGPAGRVLDRALDELRVDRETIYVTNAVKHFSFTERGKRRIHQTPSRTEVVACRPWLLAELDRIRPELVVLLGSVAAKAVFGPSFTLTRFRGQLLDMPEDWPAAKVVVTTHPSAVLRATDREDAYRKLVADLAGCMDASARG